MLLFFKTFAQSNVLAGALLAINLLHNKQLRYTHAISSEDAAWGSKVSLNWFTFAKKEIDITTG